MQKTSENVEREYLKKKEWNAKMSVRKLREAGARSARFRVISFGRRKTKNSDFYSFLAQSVCKRSDARIIEFDLSAKFGAP